MSEPIKTAEEIEALFADDDDFYCKFEDIPELRRLSRRPDINAFLLLDWLVPGDKDIVSSACHDEICLSITAEALAGIATEENIRDLQRSGVWYGYDSLCMCA